MATKKSAFIRLLHKKELRGVKKPVVQQFFDGAAAYSDKVDLVMQLDAEFNKTKLRKLITFSREFDLHEAHIFPFLLSLKRDSSARQGTCRLVFQELVLTIFKAPGIASLYVECAKKLPSKRAVSAISWLFHMSAKADKDVRQSDVVKELSDVIGTDGDDAMGLAVLLGGAVPQVVASEAPTPGGRHDNDKASFRDISIAPTIEEVLCSDPYLPLPPAPGASSSRAERATELLDRQFRLLREDYVGAVRSALADNKRHQVFHKARVSGVVSVKAPKSAMLNLSFSFPAKHRIRNMSVKKREEFLTKKKNFLAFQSVICLLEEDKNEVVAFALVTDRDTQRMAKNPDNAHIGISAVGSDWSSLFQIIGEKRAFRFICLRTAMFAYEDVLRTLQEMDDITFPEEFLLDQPSLPVSGPTIDVSDPAIASVLDTLDNEQRQAAERALTDRVSLVQGPPGTGKTFLGVAVAEMLLTQPDEVILCLSYTNHALNQFLCSLLEKGNASLFRIGGRCTDPQLIPFTSREITAPNASLAKAAYKKRKQLELAAMAAERDFSAAYAKFASTLGPGSWSRFQKLLKDTGDEDALLQFAIPQFPVFEEAPEDEAAEKKGGKKGKNGKGKNGKRRKKGKKWSKKKDEESDPEETKGEQEERQQVTEDLLAESASHGTQESQGADGFQLVGKKGKAVKADYLFRRWMQGQDQGVLKAHLPETALWKLSPAERLEQVEEWQEEYYRGDARDNLEEAAEVIRRAAEWKAAMHMETDAAKGRGRRIIGCTTTGASKYGALLAQLNVTTLLVEEAGELLEAHLLAGMAKLPALRRVILIGDHKQLRPKVDQYELTVGAGNGYDLNVSLFERIVRTGKIDVSLLAEQHRMRPEFSGIVRQMTYPHLRDHSSVSNLSPSITGLAKNFVFVDHREAEVRHADITETSRVNNFEVEFVAATVSHLLNFYKPSDLVVLTPYLGQLLPLKEALQKAKCSAHLDKKDIVDLLRAGEVSPDDDLSQQPGSGQPVRVSTVDNFQGEEANIIICSLVRSNKEKDIGFLKDPARVNVLFSRMRFGMVCFGNLECFANCRSAEGRKTWSKMKDLLAPHTLTGLPIRCERHPSEVSLVKSARELKAASPKGGCLQPCGQDLPCGHPCPLTCHSASRSHATVKCRATQSGKCPAGHFLTWRCGPQPAACKTCHEVTRALVEADKEKKAADQALGEAKNAQAIALAKARSEKARMEGELNAEDQQRDLLIEAAVTSLEAAAAKDLLDFRRSHRSEDVAVKVKEAELAQKKKTEALKRRTEKDLQKRKTAVAREEVRQVLVAGSTDKPGSTSSDEEASENLRRRLAAILASTSPEARSVVWAQQFGFFLKKGDLATCLKLAAEEGEETLAEWFGADAARAIAAAARLTAAGRAFRLEQRAAVTASLAGRTLEAQKTSRQRTLLREYLDAAFDGSEAAAAKWAETAPKLRKKKDFKDTELFALASLAALASDEEESSRPAKTATGMAIALLIRTQAATADDTEQRLVKRGEEILLQSGPRALGLATEAEEEEAGESELSKVQLRNLKYKERWEQQKANGVRSTAMDELVSLTGLAEVKELFLTTLSSVQLARKRGDKTPVSYSALFQGNPGTGKTTVARLYGKFLADVGAVPGRAFAETTGVKLVEKGIKGLQEMLANIDKAGGGLLFVDEAYQLAGSSLGQGIAILNYFLDEMVNKVGKLVVCFAGYKDQIEKLIEENEGLPSRFPHSFVFADYEEEELHSIFAGLVEKRSKQATHGDYHVEGGVYGKSARIAMRRLAQGRGSRGFGNARAVGTYLQRVLDRQSHRVTRTPSADVFELTRDDLLGPRVTANIDDCRAWKTLQDMTGLTDVKNSVLSLVALVRTNTELEEIEKPTRHVALNRLFLGSPGTGKTTVASLYGKILFRLGLLSKGDVVAKTASDFVGSAVGQSEEKTKNILKQAEGCVLLIDEAYGLCPSKGMGGGGSHDPYRENVINAIVEGVQNVPGEDLCVIMIGYEKEMQDMMRIANPGLARRFALDQAFRFPDYSDDELLVIMEKKLAGKQLKVTGAGKRAAIDVLAKQRRGKNFGNAGAVNNLISAAMLSQEKRLKDMPAAQRICQPLIPVDFDPAAEDVMDLTSIFADMVGAESVMEVARECEATVKMAQRRGQDVTESLELNFLFTGSPGTGKTTVARKFGQFFHAMGVLAGSEVVEVSASDFIPGYVGQSARKTQEILERAVGKVLFVDEAYALTPEKGGAFAGEALDELTKLLTDERFRGKMVVILAGYEREIGILLASNPGLKSRFQRTVPFADMKPEDACVMLGKVLEKKQYRLSESAKAEAARGMAELVTYSDWSNGRDVNTLAKKMTMKMAARLVGVEEPTEEQLELLLPADVRAAFTLVKSERQPPGSLPSRPRPAVNRGPTMTAGARPPSTAPPVTGVAEATEEERQEEPEEPHGSNGDGRDPGVSDTVWQQLHASKEEERRRVEELNAARREEEEARRAAFEAARQIEVAKMLKLEAERRAAEEKARRELEIARRREAEARRRLEEAERKRKHEEAMQAKLKKLGVCSAGFQWIKQAGGYRCSAGGHFVSDKQLGL